MSVGRVQHGLQGNLRPHSVRLEGEEHGFTLLAAGRRGPLEKQGHAMI